MKITVTIDLDRLAQFGGGDEPVAEFLNRMARERQTGGKFAWTRTVANVGTIDRIERAA
jgi:hypothetical protein